MDKVTGSIPVSPIIRRDVLRKNGGQSVPLSSGKVTGSIPVSPTMKIRRVNRSQFIDHKKELFGRNDKPSLPQEAGYFL